VTLPKVDLSVYIPQLSSFEQRVRSECGETNIFGMNIELRTYFQVDAALTARAGIAR
jgi:hypothetical protein